MGTVLIRGALLRDIGTRTVDGREVQVSQYRGRRNVVLIFPGAQADPLVQRLRSYSDELALVDAVVLIAPDPARNPYDAPNSAVFLTDRYGEIFFCARQPEPLPDAPEVLKWLEFIDAKCPE